MFNSSYKVYIKSNEVEINDYDKKRDSEIIGQVVRNVRTGWVFVPGNKTGLNMDIRQIKDLVIKMNLLPSE